MVVRAEGLEGLERSKRRERFVRLVGCVSQIGEVDAHVLRCSAKQRDCPRSIADVVVLPPTYMVAGIVVDAVAVYECLMLPREIDNLPRDSVKPSSDLAVTIVKRIHRKLRVWMLSGSARQDTLGHLPLACTLESGESLSSPQVPEPFFVGA